MRLRKYTKEWLEELCKDSYSVAEVLRKAGRRGGGAHKSLTRKIEEFNIDISHFTGRLWSKGKTIKTDKRLREIAIASEIYHKNTVLIKDSKVSQSCLRRYLARHNLLKYKCSFCGCDGHWNNTYISLELDHINGDNRDNRIENLRYLCPNCHASTSTYCRRKRGNKKYVSDNEFIEALKSSKNIHQALIKLKLTPYGASYTRAKDIRKKYNI